MYFTPDGRYAITVAELFERLDFRDAHTMALVRSVPVPTCPGHADFSADWRYMYASCEALGAMIETDLERQGWYARSTSSPSQRVRRT